MELDIYSIEWEYEDKLPEGITDLEYDLMYPKSEIKDGVRMFPYIKVWDMGGSHRVCWLASEYNEGEKL